MKKPILGILLATVLLDLLPIATHGTVFKFVVPLDGAQEAPGPGDPDGTGLATLWIDDSTSSIIWDISVSNIDLPVAAAHIHIGSAGVSGPVRVDFSGQLSGGPLVDPDLVGVLANPSGWYVNVHNQLFPGGAVRGQLSHPVRVPEGSPGTDATAALWFLMAFAALSRRPRQTVAS